MKPRTRCWILLISIALVILLLMGTIALTRFDAGFCSTCGSRCETAKILNTPVGSLIYRGRLSAFMVPGNSQSESCSHAKVSYCRSGGWELFLANHPWFISNED